MIEYWSTHIFAFHHVYQGRLKDISSNLCIIDTHFSSLLNKKKFENKKERGTRNDCKYQKMGNEFQTSFLLKNWNQFLVHHSYKLNEFRNTFADISQNYCWLLFQCRDEYKQRFHKKAKISRSHSHATTVDTARCSGGGATRNEIFKIR